MKHVLTVTAAESGDRLEELLARRLGLSPEQAASWIAQGQVYLDRQRQRDPRRRLSAGQQLLVHDLPQGPVIAAPQLVYRDAACAVLDKASGMPSEPTRTGGARTVADFVQESFGREARLLHRLDAGASGLLLVSLAPASRAFFAAQVSEHRLDRSYLAVAAGALPAEELRLSGRLAVRSGRTRPSSDLRARPAAALVRLLDQRPDCCLVQVRLQTGRTHQIRAQLAAAGLPLLGDSRYGGPAAPRLALHAHCLGLRLPAGGHVELHSPLPAPLRALL